MEIAQTILAQKLAHNCVRNPPQLVVPACTASSAKTKNGKYTSHPRATWDRRKMTERTVVEHMGCHKLIPYVLNGGWKILRATTRIQYAQGQEVSELDQWGWIFWGSMASAKEEC